MIRRIKTAVQYKEVNWKQDLDDAGMSRIATTLIKQRKGNRRAVPERATVKTSPQLQRGRKSPLSRAISPAALSVDELSTSSGRW